MLRFTTAGESHGEMLIAILEGVPAGLPVDFDLLQADLDRRRKGYGRGSRMKIERDRAKICSGVRYGKTLGSPISILIENRDWVNWQEVMAVDGPRADAAAAEVTRPRPGHADLAGAQKYLTHDMRDVLERASARETAARVAAGAICRMLLSHFGILVGSHILAIGEEAIDGRFLELSGDEILALDQSRGFRCADSAAWRRMKESIRWAARAGDTLGGVLELVACGVCPGLGSHAQWDCRMDGQLALALMGIPSVKAVEIGTGIGSASNPGSRVHDAIYYDSLGSRYFRKTNNAGGIEGGITNGEEVRIRIYLKPIPTLKQGLDSVDCRTREPVKAAYERSDICVVPAAAVVGEAMVSITLARSVLDKFGGDTLEETKAGYGQYLRRLRQY